MNRQRLILAGLVAALALSLMYAFWAMPRQEKAPPRPVVAKPAGSAVKTPVAGKGAVKGKPVKPSADRLLLDLLKGEPWEFPGAGRDIFRFHGRVATPVFEDLAPVAAEPPPPPPPPTPEELLRGMVARIVFLGFLDKGGVRTVFLGEGNQVFLAKTGETFGGGNDLIAREITAKELVVGWANGPETVRVQLAENEPLRPTTVGGGTTGRGALPGLRPGAGTPLPRRILMPQRVQPRPAPVDELESEEPDDEAVEEPVVPPADSINEEEPEE